jgi:hypothetical protein
VDARSIIMLSKQQEVYYKFVGQLICMGAVIRSPGQTNSLLSRVYTCVHVLPVLRFLRKSTPRAVCDSKPTI